jgi:hypothetical protein
MRDCSIDKSKEKKRIRMNIRLRKIMKVIFNIQGLKSIISRHKQKNGKKKTARGDTDKRYVSFFLNMTDDEYVYELITNETDARVCAQLIAEEFSAHNPITIFDRITSQCFFEECSWPLMKDMLNEQLSFLARHRSSGEIIGAIVAGDLYTYHHQHPYNALSLPQTIPVSDLLDEMDDRFISHDFGEELKANLVLQITVGAVRAQHSGKGVASQLNIIMCNYARDEKGFQYAIVQVTNPITRHIYVNKMGGQELTIIDPTGWIWKKKNDGLLCPYKDYKGGSIPNILIKLTSIL